MTYGLPQHDQLNLERGMKALLITLLLVLGVLVVFGIGVAQPQTNTPAASSIAASRHASPTIEVLVEGAYGPTAPNDPQLKFSGGCSVNGTYASVEGVTPKTYSYSGDSISCTYQKQSPNSWPLKVTAKRNGVTVQQTKTEAEYGVVSFAA